MYTNKNIKQKIMISSVKALVESQTARPTWDEYHMSAAYLMSSRSPSIKKKVGSVIVRDRRIISSGYNGFPPGMNHAPVYHDKKEINTIHAEQNAIADAARRGVSLEFTTLYSTYEPCLDCAKFIIASGITSVIYHQAKIGADPTDSAKQQLFAGSGVRLTSIVTRVTPITPSDKKNNIEESHPPPVPAPRVKKCAFEGCPGVVKKEKCADCEHAKVCESMHPCTKHPK